MHIRIITMRVYKDDGSLSKRLMICLNWFETFESIQSSLSDNLCNFINCTSQILAFEIDDDFYKLRVHYGAHPFCDQILVCNTFVVLATMKKKNSNNRLPNIFCTTQAVLHFRFPLDLALALSFFLNVGCFSHALPTSRCIASNRDPKESYRFNLS